MGREGLKAIEDRAIRADMLKMCVCVVEVECFVVSQEVYKVRLGITEQLPRKVRILSLLLGSTNY
jgi:hypothetical protein